METQLYKIKNKGIAPFWKSPIAYVMYVFSIIAVLYYIRKQGIKKIEKSRTLAARTLQPKPYHK